jgi:hypothetical protein
LAQINTNNEDEWVPIIEWFVELRSRGICVVYLQQAGEGGEQRGHSVSEDRIDLAIHLTATDDNPSGAAFKMNFTKEREGSLTPLRLTCTNGVWAVVEKSDEQAAKTEKPPKTKKQPKDLLIAEALAKGESTRSIADRFNVSLRTIGQVNKETKNNDLTNTDFHN